MAQAVYKRTRSSSVIGGQLPVAGINLASSRAMPTKHNAPSATGARSLDSVHRRHVERVSLFLETEAAIIVGSFGRVEPP